MTAPRPTSPQPRPTTRGDVTRSTSPLAPLPVGGEGELTRHAHTPETNQVAPTKRATS